MDLPDMPELTIVLPHEYPDVPPICDLSHYNTGTPFIQEVGELLSDMLCKKDGTYSFATLLDCWELCTLTVISKLLNE